MFQSEVQRPASKSRSARCPAASSRPARMPASVWRVPLLRAELLEPLRETSQFFRGKMRDDHFEFLDAHGSNSKGLNQPSVASDVGSFRVASLCGDFARRFCAVFVKLRNLHDRLSALGSRIGKLQPNYSRLAAPSHFAIQRIARINYQQSEAGNSRVVNLAVIRDDDDTVGGANLFIS